MMMMPELWIHAYRRESARCHTWQWEMIVTA